ncbi:MAG TPA: hypothetical protein VKN99_11940 [Polyangia bacterium]|nr:hypothetical protein [Polyangia bacterium]
MLERLGIDRVQYRALVRAALTMDFRGQPMARGWRARSPARSLVVASLVQGACSALLAVGALRSRLALETLCLAYSTTLCAVAMLADYAAQVLLPDDADILGHRPIAPRTLFAARVSNVFFFMTVLGVSLNFPPAFLGIAAGGGLRFPLTYLPVAFLADYAAAGAVLALQALLLRWLDRERFKDVLAWVQGSVALVIFITYRFVPVLTQPLAGLPADAPAWMLALPPAWFAGLTEVGLGRTGPVTLALAALALAASAIALPLALRRIAAQYGSEPVRAQARARPAERAASSTLFRLGALGLSGPARAAFDLAWKNLARERSLKMSIFPLLTMPVAMLIVPIRGERAHLGDPFEPGTEPIYFATYMGLALLALFPSYLRHSPQAEAAWLLRVAPVARPQELWRGARRALLTRLCLPVLFAMAAVLAFWAPPWHAVEHLLLALPAGLLFASLANLGLRDLPFSVTRQRGTGARTMLTIFGMYLLGFGAGSVHAHLAWHGTRGALWAWAGGLTLLAALFFQIGDRRFARRFDPDL